LTGFPPVPTYGKTQEEDGHNSHENHGKVFAWVDADQSKENKKRADDYNESDAQ
jgi:hypothetical protein